MAKEKKEKTGKLTFQDLQSIINKKAGTEVCYSLKDKNPTEVKEWIPTGSRWLDYIICKGKKAGIPIGKITNVSGLSSTGKSYLAIQIVINAQKMGIPVFYFDSESAIDPLFLESSGVDLENFHYIQAVNTEFVLETIETLLAETEGRLLFIWDSLANTICKAEMEVGFNPNATVGLKARILSNAFKHLDIPLANGQCTLLILNQLKFKIPKDQNERVQAMIDPYAEPGGLSVIYNASLNLRLLNRRSKASYVVDDKGYRIGSEVKVKIHKSRFGSEGRECSFKIVWGTNQVKIMDEESWIEPIQSSPRFHQTASWTKIDGWDKQFQIGTFPELLKNPDFKKIIEEMMYEELIEKFDKRTGNAEKFYNLDSETELPDIIEEE